MTTKVRANPWAILAVLCLAYFLSQLDITVLSVAIPAIVDDLGATLDQVVWALSSYILVLAVLLITAGRLGDLYGRRRLFLLGVSVFTVASLLVGLAPGPEILIAARAVQGLGAALFIPQTMALLIDTFPAHRRGTALGIRGAVGGTAAVLGPVLGGALVDGLGWRWIFLVNVPLGLALLVVGLVAIPRVTGEKRHRLDVAGVALASVALLCLALALNQGPATGWRPWTLALLGLAVATGALLARQQARRQGREPLLSFDLLRQRNFAAMSVFSIVISLVVIGLVLVLSVSLQTVLGFSPVLTGLLIMIASILSIAFDPVAGWLADRLPGVYLLLFGVGATAVGLVWIGAVLRPGVSWPALIAPLCVIGVGNAFLFTPLATVALAGVAPAVAGGAAGVLGSALQIGSMIGTAVIGALLPSAVDAPVDGSAVRSAVIVLVGAAAVGAIAAAATRRPAPVATDRVAAGRGTE